MIFNQFNKKQRTIKDKLFYCHFKGCKFIKITINSNNWLIQLKFVQS